MPEFYGSAVVGAKGQIVIPVKARQRLKIKPGDRVVIIGPHHKPNVVGLCSETAFSSILEKIDSKLANVRQALEDNSREKK